MFHRYKFVQQHDITDCAAACIAMICAHYKKELSITRLRDMLGTDIKGTNFVGMRKALESLGFICKAIRVNKVGFNSKFTLPAIAQVINKHGYTHFVVIYKIKKDYVIIGDPAKKVMKITQEEFFDDFTGVMIILKPTYEFAKVKNDKHSVFNRYVKLLLPQKKLFIYGIISSVIITVLGILSSLFNRIIFDEILPYSEISTLNMMIIVFGVISLTSIFVEFLRSYMMVHLSIKIDIPLMLGYFKHIYKLPMKFFSTRKTGDITTRFSDAFTIKEVFTNIALTLILDIGTALITGIILINLNPKLFIIVAVMTLISILLVYTYKRPYKKINEEQMEQSAILNSGIIENLRGIETIKSNASERQACDMLESDYIKAVKIGYRENILSNSQNLISGIISTAGNLAIMYFGIRGVIDTKFTIGSFMAFNTMMGYFMSPISNLVSLQLSLQEANISMKRFAEILDYSEEQDGKSYSYDTDKIETIEFKNVNFRYGNRNLVLKDISFKINKGEKVAIIGESGSGKSTITKLILKYYEPEDGEILVNDLEISQIDNESLRKYISYVPQNIELFSRTISDNIRITKPFANQKEILEASKKACAHDFVKKLPMGYETFLEEAGGGLSGGEKQRIALARAFLKENDFYIFDESTSNLDFATENIIFDTIYNKLDGKSMLVIAHRLSTIRGCDRIIVLDKGEIVEEGTHEALLKQKGKYYELWNMQKGIIKKKKNEENIQEVKEEVKDNNEITYS